MGSFIAGFKQKRESLMMEPAPKYFSETALRTGETFQEGHNRFRTINREISVRFFLDFQNYTKLKLTPHKKYVGGGILEEWGKIVEGGTKEAITGRKSSWTATGCWGTMSWKIGKTEKVLIVMYSIPYDTNLHSNWLGCGIYTEKDVKNLSMEEAFNRMNYGEPAEWFKRREYSDSTAALKFDGDNTFKVNTIIGTSSQSTWRLEFSPKYRKDLATQFINCEANDTCFDY